MALQEDTDSYSEGASQTLLWFVPIDEQRTWQVAQGLKNQIYRPDFRTVSNFYYLFFLSAYKSLLNMTRV